MNRPTPTSPNTCSCGSKIQFDHEWMCRPCQIKDEADQQERRWMMRLSDSCFADLIDTATVDALFRNSDTVIESKNQQSWQAARSWCRSDTQRIDLFINGAVGTGKTFMARCCLTHMLAKYVRCGWNESYIAEVTAPEASHELSTFRRGKKFRDWSRARVLLIDDMHQANLNKIKFPGFWEIINARQSMGRQTIYTSNIDRLALAKLYAKDCGSMESAKSIIDRLNPCQTIEMTGSSNRPQGSPV